MGGTYGDIALDDFVMTLGQACPLGNIYPSEASPPATTLSPTTVSPQVPDVPGFTCNFEDDQGTCGWINAKDDNFDWTIRSVVGLTSNGPEGDHTTG